VTFSTPPRTSQVGDNSIEITTSPVLSVGRILVEDVDVYKKRNKNYIREIEGYDHDTKKYKKIEHTHPTVMLSNLQNYNPTQGITYFEPNETDILLYHPNGEPRYTKEYVYDLSIPQQINKIRVNDPAIHKPETHSFKLKPKYRV